MAKEEQQLGRPGREDESEEDEPRVALEALAEKCAEQHERRDPDQGGHDARPEFVDPDDRERGGGEDVHQGREDIAQIFVEGTTVGAADEVASVPADDVPLFEQVLGDDGSRCFVVPERGVVEIDEAKVCSPREDCRAQRGVRCRADSERQGLELLLDWNHRG